jgi:hypothetical protein
MNNSNYKGGGEKTPETKAAIAYRKTLDSMGPIAPPLSFLEFFQTQILARWDKYEVTPAILTDWDQQVFMIFGAETAARAASQHAATSKGWKPKLAEIVKICKAIRKKDEEDKKRQAIIEREQQLAAGEGTQYAKNIKEAVVNTYRKFDARRLIREYEQNAFAKQRIDAHCPELIRAARQAVSGIKTGA